MQSPFTPERIAREILDQVADDPRLVSYQPYWAAHAHLLQRSGATDAADAAYAQAIGPELDPAVRRFCAC